MERFSVERMLTLQIQGVLHLGVEDHLASSLTTGKSRAARTLPRNIRFDHGASGSWKVGCDQPASRR